MYNKDLKTSNIILNELNERYFVYASFSHKKSEHLYCVMSAETHCFIFCVNCVVRDKSCVLFNGVKYYNVDKLLDAVSEYNKSLFFPAECYYPDGNVSYCEEQKIDWYLSHVLGFSRGECGYGYLSKYVFKDKFGKVLTSILFEVEKDKTCGNITKSFGDGSCVIPFSNAEDAIKKINSLISCDCGILLSDSVSVLKNISGGFGSVGDSKINTISNILKGIEGVPAKEVLIDMLESVLLVLKED